MTRQHKNRLQWFAPIAVTLTLLWSGGVQASDYPPTVKYLDTTLWRYNDSIVVRGGFEIASVPHRWYTVYYQLQRDADTPLKLPNGKALRVYWADLFTPVPANAIWPDQPSVSRWNDCRSAFAIKDIEAATNLPRGQRTTLWAVSYLYDQAAKKYRGSGWDVRTPLLVTTDEAGKVIRTDFFHTSPLELKRRPEPRQIPVREVQLALNHLQLKPGAKLYQGVELRGPQHEMLVLGQDGTALKSTNRGHFFQAIDTPAKARELVEIAYPGAIILKTHEQYQAIVAALKAIRGWDPARFLPVPEPASAGMTVTAEPGLGYRVTVLMVDCEQRFGTQRLRHVVLREFAIAPDGRMGLWETVCLRAPAWMIGYPAMWMPEFPAPPETGPGPGQGKLTAPPNLDAALNAYEAAIRSALTPAGWEIIPLARTLAANTTTIFQPGDVHNADPFVEPKR